jgi:hypothetical protein
MVRKKPPRNATVALDYSITRSLFLLLMGITPFRIVNKYIGTEQNSKSPFGEIEPLLNPGCIHAFITGKRI